MPLLDTLLSIFGQPSVRQPQAVDRFTRRPIFIQDEALDFGQNFGNFDPRTKEITVSRKSPDLNKVIQHEVLHSVFDTTAPESTLLSQPFGSLVNRSKAASPEFKRNLSDIDFEHQLIRELQDPKSQQNTLGGLLQIISQSEQERKAQDILKRMFGR